MHYNDQEIHQITQAINNLAQLGAKKTLMGPSCYDLGLSIAEIASILNLDVNSILAALHYPLLRYAEFTLDWATDNFNAEVTHLLAGLKQVDDIQLNSLRIISSGQILHETLHNLLNMLLSIVDDIRVILIKLAAHTCELRIAYSLGKEEQQALALITREIYAPLANRLGVGQIKWELEDLAFHYLEPATYKYIAQLLDEKRTNREQYIKNVTLELTKTLQEHGITAQVSGRVKHIYSIWRKMQRKKIGYDQIYDIRAVRITTETVADCYAALGVVHTAWKHIPLEFDDYIACPKPNGYRSLHTAVIGPQSKVLEIQIRTRDMHQQAELGIAAHWRYKEGNLYQEKNHEKLLSLRQILEWQNQTKHTGDIQDSVFSELFGDKIYIFTPNWDIIELPNGATVLDFAYHIHTDIGHRCRGAKVNGHIVSLNHILASGNQVEILTSKNSEPRRDWLNSHLHYIHTARARAKIHTWFKKQDRSEHISAGQAILNREIKRLGLDFSHDWPAILAKLPEYKSLEDVHAAIGAGDLRFPQLITVWQSLQPQAILPLKKKSFPSPTVEDVDIRVAGVGKLLWHIAACCHPVVKDAIIGYITKGSGITIHKVDCKNILQLPKRTRLVEVQWSGKNLNQYEVTIKIQAYDRRGLLRDISTVMSGEHADVLRINSDINAASNIATCIITIEIADMEMLSNIITKIQQIPNVLSVYRTQ